MHWPASNADVVGLMEIQNNGNTAVNDLVAGLNAVVGAGTYESVALPTGGTGTDAIRVAMIYKPARVSPIGAALSDTNAIHSRPPLVQTFAAANGERFSVVVNHFKSKGSCPAEAGCRCRSGRWAGLLECAAYAAGAGASRIYQQLAGESPETAT
jgi:predicted extracellular nuclease